MFRSLLGSCPVIDAFDGKYAFLSNAYRHHRPVSETIGPVTLRYPTVAHAMMGAHYECLGDKITIAQANDPYLLLLTGQGQVKTDLTDYERFQRLVELLREKFECPELRQRLLATHKVRLTAGGLLNQRALELVREEVSVVCSTTHQLNPSSGTLASMSF